MEKYLTKFCQILNFSQTFVKLPIRSQKKCKKNAKNAQNIGNYLATRWKQRAHFLKNEQN